MTGGDIFDKDRLGATDVLNSLAQHRPWQKSYEITGMTRCQCGANLTLLLHTADARPVASARIDHHDGGLGRINFHAIGWDDTDQRVIHRTRKGAAIAHKLDLKAKDVRYLLGDLLHVDVAAFPQHVEEQDRPLPGVLPVIMNSGHRGAHLH